MSVLEGRTFPICTGSTLKIIAAPYARAESSLCDINGNLYATHSDGNTYRFRPTGTAYDSNGRITYNVDMSEGLSNSATGLQLLDLKQQLTAVYDLAKTG